MTYKVYKTDGTIELVAEGFIHTYISLSDATLIQKIVATSSTLEEVENE